MIASHDFGPCSACGAERERLVEHYCRACHAAYMREWRKVNTLTPEQRRKDNARSTAQWGKRIGLLKPEPCASCSAPKAEMHHPDYDLPLDVVWLCRSCHLELHRRERGPLPDTHKAKLRELARKYAEAMA
ncbi:MAG: hypothetical protein A3E78_07400 [Alphaproteobacteria bacterium RIFCSPHIGHO2_12_FULL_63_12]|nr:MAG: hypothetical protein A3E78_07400 [Alphaproteobacteria bacterium RIFCSPHIGHO2_12_FULL_63_12]